jgi:hypothetical protein
MSRWDVQTLICRDVQVELHSTKRSCAVVGVLTCEPIHGVAISILPISLREKAEDTIMAVDLRIDKESGLEDGPEKIPGDHILLDHVLRRRNGLLELFLKEVVEKLGMLQTISSLPFSIFFTRSILQLLDLGLQSRPTVYEWLEGAGELQALQCDGHATVPFENDLEEIFQQRRLDDDRVESKNTARVTINSTVPSYDGMLESVSVLGGLAYVLG